MQPNTKTKPHKKDAHTPARPNAINKEITAKEIRLVGSDGNQLGVVSLTQALEIANIEMLDLVEISPMAEPPVCKIMDYSKYLFEKGKEEKARLKTQRAKQVETSEIRLRPATDEHDYQTKLRHMRGFIDRGDKVKISLRLRGRELTHEKLAFDMMARIKKDMEDITICESYPTRIEGRQMNMLLAPVKSK